MRRANGFTLLEMAIVMMIGGLLMACVLRLYAMHIEKQRYDITKERLAEVRTALTAYVSANNRLPCPESPMTPVIEEPDAPPADSCAPNAEPPPGVTVFRVDRQQQTEATDVWTGAVPAGALHIAGVLGLDGWNNHITYAVTRALTYPDALKKLPPAPGILTISDPYGNNLLDVPHSGRYVLVSHGVDGKGAWTSHGVHLPCTPGALDSQNCDGDDVFIVAAYSLKQGDHFHDGGYYDDLIVRDGQETRASLVDKLEICNGRRGFFAPDNRRADDQGCVTDEGAWQGGCLRNFTLVDGLETTPFAEAPLSPPAHTLPPKDEQQTACACQKDYDMITVHTWDDLQTGAPDIDNHCGIETLGPDGMHTANTGDLFLKADGTPLKCVYKAGTPASNRSTLYTCRK